MIYDPRDWYWLAPDARLYSSASGALIQPDDPAYLAWRARVPGLEPTPWPLNDAGEATDAALQEVLAPYGIRVRRADAIVDAIDALRAAKLVAGAPIGGLRVAIDDTSRGDIGGMATTALAALSSAAPWPESYAAGWITMSNVRLPLPTPADGLALAAAVGDWYARIVQHARSLKDAVLAAEDDAALDAIDIAAGWPDGEV